MAHVSGSVGSWADLITSIRNACVANGFTLSGDVLHKGGAYVRLYLSGSEIRVEAGTGLGAGNTLLAPAPSYVWFGQNGTNNEPVFPIQYHAHIHEDPDEVYVMVNYNGTYWQWVAFGVSSLAAALAPSGGTGAWFGATFTSGQTRGQGFVITSDGGGGGYATPGTLKSSAGLFNSTGGWGTTPAPNCYIHHGMTALDNGWNSYSNWTIEGARPQAIAYQEPMLRTQPNTWSGQSILVPIVVTIPRAESKTTVVAQLGHARYCRNDNYGHMEIIEFGSDKWRVYPLYFKDSSARNGGSNVFHSGTFAHAIRYDGT